MILIIINRKLDPDKDTLITFINSRLIENRVLKKALRLSFSEAHRILSLRSPANLPFRGPGLLSFFLLFDSFLT